MNATTSYVLRQREGKPGGGKGPLLSEEVSLTLATNNDQIRFCIQSNIINRADTAGGNGKMFKEEVAYTVDTKSPHAIANEYVVRRLMPVECERLQGFPDGHTEIPYRGKDASKCPDGPRYKALGNSMAVPCMRWIGERIQAVEKMNKMKDGHTITLTYDQVCLLRTLVKNELEEDYTTIRNIKNKFKQDTEDRRSLIRVLVGPLDNKESVFAMLDAICNEVEPEAREESCLTVKP